MAKRKSVSERLSILLFAHHLNWIAVAKNIGFLENIVEEKTSTWLPQTVLVWKKKELVKGRHCIWINGYQCDLLKRHCVWLCVTIMHLFRAKHENQMKNGANSTKNLLMFWLQTKTNHSINITLPKYAPAVIGKCFFVFNILLSSTLLKICCFGFKS